MRKYWTIVTVALLAGGAGVARAQSWADIYQQGLNASKQQRWSDARAHFQRAAAVRPDDVSGPTFLPGPVTEQRTWRRGAPYSPRFGAAYAALKGATMSQDPDEADSLLRAAAREFEDLIDKGQHAKATYYFLGQAFSLLKDADGNARLDARFAQMQGRMTWKVDLEIIAPEERGQIADVFGDPVEQSGPPLAHDPSDLAPPGTEPGPLVADPGADPGTWHPPLVMQPDAARPNILEVPRTTVGSVGASRPVGRVAPVANKFALVIGNSSSLLEDLAVPFATKDAQIFRDSLVHYTGYPDPNVDVLLDATAEQIREAVQNLAERIPEGATVTFFFAGVGVHVDERDYLAGVDADSENDTSRMVPKMAVYQPFMSKGARIFAFYEVNRPLMGGKTFGFEYPMVGMIAQMQATKPGDRVQSVNRNGDEIGVFVDAASRVFAEMRSNRLPVMEFAWQTFNAMKRSGAGLHGGSTTQVITLPVLSNMASDTRF